MNSIQWSYRNQVNLDFDHAIPNLMNVITICHKFWPNDSDNQLKKTYIWKVSLYYGNNISGHPLKVAELRLSGMEGFGQIEKYPIFICTCITVIIHE